MTNNRFRYLLLFIMGTWQVLAQNPTPATFRQAACFFPLPDDNISCGILEVPEDYDQVNGTRLELPVIILHAHTTPLPDPVIHLEGGPGSSGLLSVEWWVDHPLRINRDFIVYDQRGAGFSEPSLNCREVEESDYGVFSTPLSHCRYRLAELGVNFNAYTSANSARDVNALRLALAYEQVNLYGISYGSRLALTVMRDYPHIVRSAVLDSVFPPEEDLLADQIFNRLKAYRNLFAACKLSATCNKAYPNLEMVFYEIVQRYDDTPYVFTREFDYVPRQIDGTVIIQALFQAMYRTAALPVLPYALYDMKSARTDQDHREAYLTLRGYITPEFLRGKKIL